MNRQDLELKLDKTCIALSLLNEHLTSLIEQDMPYEIIAKHARAVVGIEYQIEDLQHSLAKLSGQSDLAN